METFKAMSLHPWFISGLVAGEGCFSVSFTLHERLNVGIETRPSFSISLNRRDLALIQQVQTFFQCGAIRYSRSDRTYKYEVRSVQDLVSKVLPHFVQYPLQGSKSEDFAKFDEICQGIRANHHLSKKYLPGIIEKAYSMNPSGKRKHEKSELLRILGE